MNRLKQLRDLRLHPAAMERTNTFEPSAVCGCSNTHRRLRTDTGTIESIKDRQGQGARLLSTPAGAEFLKRVNEGLVAPVLANQRR